LSLFQNAVAKRRGKHLREQCNDCEVEHGVK
jgi:hypothetical protein